MATITQTITQFPPAPDSSSDSPTEFNAKADAFVNHQASSYVSEVNTWAEQANTLAGEINNIASSLPDGVINDSATSATDTWSSNKISSIQPDEGSGYIKFDNGTLIVYGSSALAQDASFTHVAKVTVSFPISFVSEPSITMSLSYVPVTTEARERCQSVASATVSTAALGYYSASGTDISELFGKNVSYQAIGRWK